MSERSRYLVAAGHQGLRIAEESVVEPGPGELRIRAERSLVSPGTERYYVARCLERGEVLRLGYCSSGRVDAVGAGTSGFALGDRVVAMGWQQAHHGEVVRVPFRLCVKVPDEVALDRAVLAALGATAVHAVDRAALSPGDAALIIGAGLVGQLVAQCAAARGVPAYVADLVWPRADAAARRGVRPIRIDGGAGLVTEVERQVGRGRISKIFLCLTGAATDSFRDAVAILGAVSDPRHRPTIVCVGRFQAEVGFSVELGNLDIRYSARCGAGYRDEEYAHGRREVVAPAGEGTVTENLQRALALVAGGALELTHEQVVRVPFADAVAAHGALARSGASIAIQFAYQESR